MEKKILDTTDLAGAIKFHNILRKDDFNELLKAYIIVMENGQLEFKEERWEYEAKEQ